MKKMRCTGCGKYGLRLAIVGKAGNWGDWGDSYHEHLLCAGCIEAEHLLNSAKWKKSKQIASGSNGIQSKV